MFRTTAALATLLFILFAPAGEPAYVRAQDSAGRSATFQDIVFRQIRLSPDVVIGVDTTGQVWRYDFDQAAFEKSSSIPTPGGARESENLPVEVRCTDEIRVKPFERRSVTVGVDEFIDGNITVYGRVTIRGWVKGNVVSIMGPVTVYEGSQVDGDISAPEISVRRGGIVQGRQIITDKLDLPESIKSSVLLPVEASFSVPAFCRVPARVRAV